MGYNFIFPGVGEDYRKFIKESNMDQEEKYLEYCGFAKELSDIDLAGFVEGKPVEDPILTAWCLGYTVDCLLYEKLRKDQVEPRYMAGYSMGLNTALRCAGSISYIDGINILKILRKFKSGMKKEGMVAFIGWERLQVQQLIEAYSYEDRVWIACENNPYCFILSGDKDALDELSVKAEEEGVYKISKLDVDYAFHTELYKEPSKRLEQYINELAVKVPNVPVLSVVDQTWITTEEQVRDELVRNLYSKMKWVDTIQMLLELTKDEKTPFLEISFGESLTKASRIMGSKKRFITYETMMKSQEERSCIETR